jgi:hypothetical protein
MAQKTQLDKSMDRNLPENLNPETKKKFEAIHSYDPYESVIADLNKAFHRSYNLAIHKTHQRLGREDTPVIIMFGEKAMLFHDGKQETVEFIPDLYHRVKAISHVSFGVYVTLAHNGYGPLTYDNHKELENIQELIEKALSILDQEPIPANYFDVQRITLENALAIVDEVLLTGLVDKGMVLDFGKENIHLYLENAALGTILELDILHETVMRWKEQIGAEIWEALYVVICAGHQARYREASKQYFQRLLGEKEGDGAHYEDRVVYAEHIYDVDAALDLLARHINDQQASIELFNDPTRLQEDLMSDGAAAYLEELLPD